MPLNSYFLQGSASEQRLVQDLINEQLKIYGQDVVYLPRKMVNRDTILNEVSASQFDDSYRIEAYLANYEGFTGGGDILSKFGVQSTDGVTLIISKERYDDMISPFLASDSRILVTSRPQEGDLIYFPLTDGLFQILDVQATNTFYQTGSLQTFDLVCELFAYSDEKIDTGIEEIDDIEVQQSFVRTFELAASPAPGTFQVGETVTGGTSGKTGEVAKWDATTRYLYLINMTGVFTVGEILTGGTSLATGTYETKQTTDEAVETLAQINAGITDTATSNKQIETDADSILDFSEGNPFSEGTNY